VKKVQSNFSTNHLLGEEGSVKLGTNHLLEEDSIKLSTNYLLGVEGSSFSMNNKVKIYEYCFRYSLSMFNAIGTCFRTRMKDRLLRVPDF
jgi:hypothetical protein